MELQQMATARRAKAVSIGRDIGVALAVLQGLYLAIVQTPQAAIASDAAMLARHGAALESLEKRMDTRERMDEARDEALGRIAADVAGIQGELRRLSKRDEKPELPTFVRGARNLEARPEGG